MGVSTCTSAYPVKAVQRGQFHVRQTAVVVVEYCCYTTKHTKTRSQDMYGTGTSVSCVSCAEMYHHVYLHGDVVDVQQADLIRHGLDPEHDPRGQRDEVAVEGLGDEGERSRGPEVALDNLVPI